MALKGNLEEKTNIILTLERTESRGFNRNTTYK